MELHLAQQQRELAAYCAGNGIRVMAGRARERERERLNCGQHAPLGASSLRGGHAWGRGGEREREREREKKREREKERRRKNEKHLTH